MVSACSKPSPAATAPKTNLRDPRSIVAAAIRRGEVLTAGQVWQVDLSSGVPAARNGDVVSVWMQVDPATAKRWLDNNLVNRRIDEDTVVAYARDMKGGVWLKTHQGIAFNDKGELIDGQHRLLAIVRTGITVTMMVTFGLPHGIQGREMKTMDAVDRGRPRSVADQLKIQHGIQNGSAIAQLAATLGSTCCGERTRKLSVQQTLDVYHAFEEPITYVLLQRPREVGLRSIGVLAGFVFTLATENGVFSGATPICEMWKRLVTGEGLKPKMPITHLREFLMSDAAKLLFRSTNRACVELVAEAVFLEAKGKPIPELKLGTTGIDHFRSLQQDRIAKIAAIFHVPSVTEGRGAKKKT